MTLDEFYKLYPTYKDNPNFVNNPNLLLQKIESKFGVPLSDLSKEDLQKGLYIPNDAVLNLRVNVPTYGGGLGELFNSDGSVALPDGSKAAIMDCDKCGGSKSKFMFGLDTEEVSDG